MVNMTKKTMAKALALVSVPVLFFFQNCSQSGSAATAGSGSLGVTSTSDSMVISNSNDIRISPPTNNSDDNISSDKGSIGRCDQLVISDILLKIVSISSQNENPNAISLEIVDSDKSVSLEKLNLKVKAKKSERMHDLTLILNAQGNKVLTADNVVIDVQTPANQQFVVRVTLLHEYTVAEGQVYNLVLKVDSNELISATNKNDCLFKPLIQSADLTSL